jgi:hypothetical protein
MSFVFIASIIVVSFYSHRFALALGVLQGPMSYTLNLFGPSEVIAGIWGALGIIASLCATVICARWIFRGFPPIPPAFADIWPRQKANKEPAQ